MEKMSLAQSTAKRLKNEIVNEKKYRPGQKLPNENILSNQYGISRSTLREAIRILVSEGILEVQRGNGTFVLSQLNQKTTSSFQTSSDIKVTLKDLYETRLIFEPEAASIACKRASDQEIQEILRLGNICQ